MRVTTYTCDRCGADSTKMNELDIKVVRAGYGQYSTDRLYEFRSAEWCKACRVETGLELPKDKNPSDVEASTYPTLEDLIREIVQQEILNSEYHNQ